MKTVIKLLDFFERNNKLPQAEELLCGGKFFRTKIIDNLGAFTSNIGRNNIAN